MKASKRVAAGPRVTGAYRGSETTALDMETLSPLDGKLVKLTRCDRVLQHKVCCAERKGLRSSYPQENLQRE